MFSKLIKKNKKFKIINSNKPKKICSCYNIYNYDIMDALNNGCRGINDIRKTTKAGTACGKCNASLEYEVYRALKK
ncbi:(2Fe-2S)-binding protein [Terrisporobacter glycolicus]|uniref:(2Fe-2S)-binding protein n=1 Tax=Terrisporobacter glycolicus TaxID=36841 RepID=UPI000CDEA35B